MITTPTGRSSRVGTFARAGLSLVLVASGAGLLWASVALRGDHPTSLNDPLAVVFGVTGVAALALAVISIALLAPSSSGREGISTVAQWCATAALVAYLALFLWPLGKNIGRDHAVPTVGLLVPAVAGLVAVAVLVAGLIVRRRPAVGAASATLVMAATSGLVPLWLWGAQCELYRSLC
jgi:hypothetical protein